ncbi:MAG: GTP-binding protein [Nanoarchaeota archaeon]|nr:GTP-binding protein [Nanoarchaeota archaeon]
MSKSNLNIVFAGHVDHGKSTLIGRLLYDTKSLPQSIIDDVEQVSKELGKEMEFAYLLDSLEEERKDNITIDTTQIFFKTPERDYTIIDVPGHKEFLKNMITGASMAESALLIVDADEGVQEQTGRHAYVLNMLGIEQVIIVINKMDVVKYDKNRFETVKNEVLQMFNNLGMTPTRVVPISALKGDNVTKKSENIEWAETTLINALNSLKGKEDLTNKPMRFLVQDVYDNNTLVGRVESGKISEKEEITILPYNMKNKIDKIKVWNQEKNTAKAGENIGIILNNSSKMVRGDVLYTGKKPMISDCFETDVFWLSDKPVSVGESLLWRCATQEVPCTIKEIKKKIDSSNLKELENNNKMEETEVGKLIIQTEKPVVFQKFHDIESLGRFVLVKNDITLAGGVIT